MSKGIINRLREASTYPADFTRADFDLSAGVAGQSERIATTKLRRPHALRDDKPVSVAVMAYEEIVSDATAGNQEVINLANDLTESGATDTDIIVYEEGSLLAVDSVDYANDTVTVTPANASATLGIFYAAADQARVVLRKRDPSDNDESLFDGDVGLLHQRDHAKEPVYLDFESTLQPVIPTNWHVDVYVNAPYQAALAMDVDGDGEDEPATNGLLSFPARGTPDEIPGLGKAVKDDRSAR